MWAPVDSAQAETASLSSWSIEQQQNRWGGVSDYSNNATFDEHVRSIVPPAFRNSNAKIVWQEPKSLEANINEALGIWQATPLNQFSLEQEPLSGTSHFPPSFAACGAANGWSQPEIEQRNWDMSTQSQSVRAAVPFCGGLTQNKIWPNEDQVWGGTQRPPVFPTAPPPPAYATGWQQNTPRGNVFPLPTRFGGPPFESNAVMGSWVQRPMNESVQPPVPPSTIPPPQRSRLQNVWGGTPAVNNTVNGMYLPPPTVEYSMPNGLTQWNPSTGSSGAAVMPVPVVPKPQFAQNFVNRSPPPPNAFNSYSQVSKSDSFMGENAVWQDPEGEVRKWQRDTGTAAWGDPEKQQKEIRRWIVPVGKEYDNAENESGSRIIVPLGWGDLPSKSLSNSGAPNSTTSLPSWPTKNAQASTVTAPSSGWGNRSASGTAKSAIPTLWDILSEHQPTSVESGWMPTDGANNAAMPASTQQIVEQLRQAVAKGLIDVSLLSKPLPNEALSEMRTLLSRIPVLEQAENDLARLMSAVKINNDPEGGSGRMDTPTDLMTTEQRSEYNRLVIEIAATKTEILTIRERIRGNSDTAGSVRPATSLPESQRMQPQQQQPAVTTTSPRFGDSILDVAVRVEQQKLFSM
ncbi:unnamed protein product [Litomosoides sigmodontis]|uniref:GW182 middle domain-containing protein n=1 Tax=Litomosoides sigmodontis TaxID=42156 RepID=A0A3P6TQZ9_LITSI|nr:unnamed protein product [Litomosoides sigmodontis]